MVFNSTKNTIIFSMLVFITVLNFAAAPKQAQPTAAGAQDEAALTAAYTAVQSFKPPHRPDYSAAQAAYSLSMSLKMWASQDPEMAAAIKKNDEYFRTLLAEAQKEEGEVHQDFVNGMLRKIDKGVLDTLEWTDEEWPQTHSMHGLAQNIRNLMHNKDAFSQASLKLGQANKKQAQLKKENEDLKKRVESLRAQKAAKDAQTKQLMSAFSNIKK